MADSTTTARIGMVNYINTAPLYEVWKRSVREPGWRVTEAPPAVLNTMLCRGELDLGFVSSHEYAAHPGLYRIMDGPSISASGQVGSVFLFSELPPEELSGQLVLLSRQSQTSAALVKILLEEYSGARPRYVVGDVLGRRFHEGKPVRAVMAIGDDALRLLADGSFPHCWDLGLEWRRRTGLPFVFAVWAVREEFCRQEPDTVFAIHRQLLRCMAEGKQDLEAISRQVAPKIPMTPEACLRYLAGIEYDLGAAKKEGLEKFFSFLIKRGEAPTAALPLKICNAW